MRFGIWLGGFSLSILDFFLVFWIKGFWILLRVLGFGKGFSVLAQDLRFRVLGFGEGLRAEGFGICFRV